MQEIAVNYVPFSCNNPLQRLTREAPDVPPALTGVGPSGMFLTARREEWWRWRSVQGAITLSLSAAQSDWPRSV